MSVGTGSSPEGRSTSPPRHDEAPESEGAKEEPPIRIQTVADPVVLNGRPDHLIALKESLGPGRDQPQHPEVAHDRSAAANVPDNGRPPDHAGVGALEQFGQGDDDRDHHDGDQGEAQCAYVVEGRVCAEQLHQFRRRGGYRPPEVVETDNHVYGGHDEGTCTSDSSDVRLHQFSSQTENGDPSRCARKAR